MYITPGPLNRTILSAVDEHHKRYDQSILDTYPCRELETDLMEEPMTNPMTDLMINPMTDPKTNPMTNPMIKKIPTD